MRLNSSPYPIGPMFRMTFILVAALYVTMIVVPGENHGAEIQVTSSSSRGGDPIVPASAGAEGGWIQALINSAASGGPRGIVAPLSQRQVVTSGSALMADDNGDLMLATASGEFYLIDAVINPVDLISGTGESVPSVTVAALADPEEVQAAIERRVAAAPEPEPEPALWRVAASAVNFREGPSTNTAILTSLRRGEEVEYLGAADEDWGRLRVVGSGLEGFMAMEFLEPVN